MNQSPVSYDGSVVEWRKSEVGAEDVGVIPSSGFVVACGRCCVVIPTAGDGSPFPVLGFCVVCMQEQEW